MSDGRSFEVPVGMMEKVTIDSGPFSRKISLTFNIPDDVIVTMPYENREQGTPEVKMLADPQDRNSA